MNNRVPVPKGYVDAIIRDTASLPEPIRVALLSVRRHRFLDGWYRLDVVDRRPDYHYISFDRNAPSDEDLSVIYSDQALITAHNQVFPTSSTSQPSLVARMLQLIEIDSGMRVLEIGTGTGYNAALLAELNGEPSRVFTIECQQAVAEKAQRYLREEGYGGIHVIQGDGFEGAAEGAPFDRLIATVGCSDISPRWLEQLTVEGIMLIPLNHGFSDPLVRLMPDPNDPTCAVGKIVERSAFMKIQGILEWGNPWRTFMMLGLPKEPEWSRRLPDHLTKPDPTSPPVADRDHWCFRFFMNLCSRELWDHNRGYGLADPGSNTVVVVSPEGIEAYSATHDKEACERLYVRLLSIHQRWVDLGYPSPTDFTLRLSPKIRFDTSSTDPAREWTIERPYFLETIRLP